MLRAFLLGQGLIGLNSYQLNPLLSEWAVLFPTTVTLCYCCQSWSCVKALVMGNYVLLYIFHLFFVL